MKYQNFAQVLLEKNCNITPLEDYKGSLTKMRVKCDLCENVWEVTPNSLLRGTGCPVCAKDKIYEKTRKKHEIFMKEMEIKNPKVKILGEYINDKEYIECQCTICGTVWEGTPCHLLRGTGCPSCAMERRKEALKRAREQRKK